MKFAKKLMCIFVIFALTVPYAVYAEGDEICTGETITVNFYDNKEETNNISLNSAGDEAYELSEQEVKFVNYIAEDIATNHAVEVEIPEEYTIDSSRFDSDLVGKIVAAIQEDYPEVFYIKEHLAAYCYRDSAMHITSVFLEDYNTHENIYSMTDEEINAAWDEIDAEVDKIVAEAKLLDSDLEKILYVHDYIVSNYKYDERVYNPALIGTESRTLYSMIHEKTGVCQGYTYLFMTVMQELGIDCITVPSDELNHIWNKVKLDDEWYNIDLTSDDPISQLSISITHDYFLLNDDEIKALDPSKVTNELFLITEDEEDPYKKLVHGKITFDEETGKYKITNGENDEEVIIESGTLSINEHHQYVISEGEGEDLQSVLWQQIQHSHHYTWNKKNWDGTDSTVSDSTSYSQSPLHDIKGKTIYYDDKFICVDDHNNICTIAFGEEEQTLEPIYKPSSEYVWRVYGEKNRYYQNIVSALELYYDKIYFNSPDIVYELNPATGAAVTVYDYETENPDKTDEAKTYFYGLQVKDDKLYAEYSEDAGTADLMEIPIEIIEPIADPLIEPESGGDVTVTIDIPESRAEEVIVYIAEYDDNGALIKLVSQAEEGNATQFTPEDKAKTIKAFMWGANNEPVAYGEYEIPKVTLKAENLDDAKTDISTGTLYFYSGDTAGASTKYEIDSDAEWYVNGVKLTDAVKGSYDTISEYAYNEFILGRYSTVTLRKTGNLPAYDKVVIDTHTTAVVYKVIADDDGVDISMRDPNINPMTGNFPEDTIDFMYVYNEKSEETSSADYTFTLNGKQIQPSELKKNDVLSIVYDETGDFEDSSFYNVTVSRKSQRGVIEEVNNGGKTVIFGGNTYATAEGAFIDFETGDDCIFFFDTYGRIAYTELAEPEIPSIGILADVHEDNGVYTAELIDNTGTKKTYSVRAANGETYMDYFKEFKDEEGNWIVNRSVAYPQLVVRYNIYGLELIIGERKLVATDSSGLYKASSERISKIKLSDKTVIFDITGIDEDIDNYRVISVDDLVDETNYTGYAYDMRKYYNNKYMGLVITGALSPVTTDTP